MDRRTEGSAHPDEPGSVAVRGDHDWRAIEGSPEFRELVSSRRRFVVPAAAVFLTFMIVYLVLAATADDLMGSQIVDGFPVAWAFPIALVLMTWVITWLYLRKADREWEPLEHRAADRAAAEVTTGAGNGHRGSVVSEVGSR